LLDQKPIELGRWLLKNYAIREDLIFDPFAGSGSFLVACKQLGFDYVGCELNTEYIDVINNRLNQKTVGDFTPKGVVELALNDSANAPSKVLATPKPIV